jgi:hypothetical protein
MMDFNNLNATELKDKISLFLDNQLDSEETNQLLEEINNDPQKEKWVDEEKKYRQFVRTNFKKQCVTNGFVENLKNQMKVQ